jgi:hypothetical protein
LSGKPYNIASFDFFLFPIKKVQDPYIRARIIVTTVDNEKLLREKKQCLLLAFK